MVKILDVNFSELSMQNTVTMLHEHVETKNNLFQVVTANPEIVMYANKDSGYSQLLKEVDLITPDGIGVVLASKMIGKPLPERVAGYDLLHSFLDYRERNKIKTTIYCLGASEHVIKKASEELASSYSYVSISGFHHGYFEQDSAIEENIISEISESHVDLLLVGLGFPRQEQFIFKHKDKLNAKLAIGCGGTFDVLAGNIKRAPKTFQRLGLEWFYRLLKEPKRFRRQLELPKFVLRIMKSKN